MTDSSPETQWWRLNGLNCTVTVDRADAILDGGKIGSVYYVDVTNQHGERHKFLCNGMYWLGYDMRIRGHRPAVGEWEPVPAPDERAPEIDFEQFLAS
jgi:hypothetical protein